MDPASYLLVGQLGEPPLDIRDTVDCDRPISFATARVDQCVAFFGADSSVRFTTAATCSSVTVLVPPDRGMSPRPAIRCSTNRFRHRPTACGAEPNCAVTSLFDAPLAQARMIRHRRAHACGVERRRNPERLPETARLLSSALLGEQSGKPPDAAVSDAGFSVGLELILDGIATRIGHATA